MAQSHEGPRFLTEILDLVNRGKYPTYTAPSGGGSANYGYWGGGSTPGRVNTIQRTDFSNDTQNALDRSDLSEGVYNEASNADRDWS